MTSRREFVSTVLTLAAVPVIVSGQTCAASGGKKSCCASSSSLKASGATVLQSDAKKAKIKIVCPKCGKVEEREIDTPTADKPFALDWVCPKCGHKMKVTVEVAKAE